MIDFFQVGIITGTHGLQGEVKVYPTTEDPARFRELKTLLLDLGTEKRELTVAGVRFHKALVLVRFAEFSGIEEVERLRGKSLLIRREQAIPLKEGEYYIPDLIGLRVETEDGRVLGTLTRVLQTGANDVYAVQRTEGGELLLPAIRDCILETNPEAGFMRVHLLPGLEDL